MGRGMERERWGDGIGTSQGTYLGKEESIDSEGKVDL